MKLFEHLGLGTKRWRFQVCFQGGSPCAEALQRTCRLLFLPQRLTACEAEKLPMQ